MVEALFRSTLIDSDLASCGLIGMFCGYFSFAIGC